jgi:Mg-chelatase subunit ChlD
MVDAGKFGLLASAIASRHIVVRWSTEGDSLAYCDVAAIVLPTRLCNHCTGWREVVAQALLLSMGSLEPALVRRLIGRPTVSRRYAFLEVLRAVQQRGKELPIAFTEEEIFRKDLGCCNSAAESLRVAKGQRSLGDIPDFIGTLRPLRILRNAFDSPGLFSPSSKERVIDASRGDNVQELRDEDETEQSSILRMVAIDTGVRNPLSGLLNSILGARVGPVSRKDAGGGGGEMSVGRLARVWRRGVHAIRGVFDLDLSAHLQDGYGVLYPEWDDSLGAYRKNWVCIEEVEPWRHDGPADLGTVLHTPSSDLVRQLSGLGLDYEMHQGQVDGSDLDVGRLIESAIQMRSGQPPSNLDVYRSSRKTRRDLGVVIEIDVSGSTQEYNAAGQSVFHDQLSVAYQIGRALEQLGDRVALYGFQSWGRAQVRLMRLKGHEDIWDGTVIHRFAQLEPQGYTRTGAAVRHAERLLRRTMRLPNRLLILVTDGFPYDHDYEGRYAEEDTRKALAEARAAGTACVCLCIGGLQARDRLAAIFGGANILAIEDPNGLIRRIRPVFTRALSAVAHRKLARTRLA